MAEFNLPELSLGVLLVALLPLALVDSAKAWRWQVLCRPGPPPYRRCLRAQVAGQITNALVPVRAGEALGVALLSRGGGGIGSAVASLAGTKALDAMCLALIAVAVLGGSALGKASWGLAAACLVALAALPIAFYGQSSRRALERAAVGRWLRLGAIVDVVEAARDARVLAVVLVASLAVWAFGLAANAVVLQAVGVPATPDLAARMLVAGYLVGFVPAPPARLGVFEAGVAVALTSAGVGVTEAVAAALALHLCMLASLGLLFAIAVARRA